MPPTARRPNPGPDPGPDHLCLACGLCCNGVLFKDVELQPQDNPRRLLMLGLPLRRMPPRRLTTKPTTKPIAPTAPIAPLAPVMPGPPLLRLPQPCPALQPDCRCRIYAERPSRCREFDCALRQALAAGQVNFNDALRLVRRARRLSGKVSRLLSALGDRDESTPLSRRLKNTRRRLETGPADARSAALFAELALNDHRLNLLLSERFLPQVS